MQWDRAVANGATSLMAATITPGHLLLAASYIGVAMAIATALWASSTTRHRIETRVGVAAMIVLVALAVDRGFAAGDDVANSSRYRAVREGWYGGRRPLQALLVVAVLLSLVLLAVMWRRLDLDLAWTTVGGAVSGLAVLRLVRLISLHQIDSLFARGTQGVTLYRVLELAGLMVAIAGVLWVVSNERVRRSSRRKDVVCSGTGPTG